MNAFYDLHLHSCLSPCGDADMTPCNIVNMCALAGLQVIALTDHNAADNCPAFLAAAERAGVLALPGMELTTREEIHVICLFGSLGAALSFGEYVKERLPKVENRPEIFGGQLVMDENDNVLREESLLLLNAADIGVHEVCALVGDAGGAAFPAHVDRPSFSLLASLGTYDPSLGFGAAEVSRLSTEAAVLGRHPEMSGLRFITNSDAHRLGDILDASASFRVERFSRRAVIDILRSAP